MNSKIKFELTNHYGKDIILIIFEYDLKLIERVKKLVGAKWSKSKKAWYVLDTPQYRQKFGLEPKPPLGKEVLMHIHANNLHALLNFNQHSFV